MYDLKIRKHQVIVCSIIAMTKLPFVFIVKNFLLVSSIKDTIALVSK